MTLTISPPRRTTRTAIFGLNEITEMFCLDGVHRDDLACITMDAEYLPEDQDSRFGLPLVALESIVDDLAEWGVFLAVGYHDQLRTRLGVHERLQDLGAELVSWINQRSLVHPSAEIGDGCTVMEGAIVQARAIIGPASVIWSGAHVGHHSNIGASCYVSPCAVLSGNVVLEDRVFVGSGAVIRDGARVGTGSIIGAGAVVACDVPPGAVVRPARSVIEVDGAGRLDRI